MKFAYVCEDGIKIGASNNTIYIEKENKKIAHLPINTIQGILIFGNCQATVEALNRLTSKGVRAAWMTKTGKLKFFVTGPLSLSENRIRQFNCYADSKKRFLLAKWISLRKIDSQVFYVKNFYRDLGSKDSFLLLAEQFKEKIKNKNFDSNTIEFIRGIEGYVSRIYFDLLKNAVKNPYFRFESRNYHPARDLFNCALSFAYGFCKQVLSSIILTAGLDPYIGFLHQFRSSKEALVYDLIEEFRPYIDSRIIKIVNKKQLEPKMFMQNESGEVRINPKFIKTIVSLYHEEIISRKEPRYEKPFYSAVGDAVEDFCNVMSKVISGE